MNIGFIGIGNMGGAIIKGYVSGGQSTGDRLFAYSRTKEKLLKFCEEVGAEACLSVADLAVQCQIIFLAVKPKDIDGVLKEIAPIVRAEKEKVIVSVAAGITMGFMEKTLGEEAKILRAMPNTPAQVGEGMTSLSRNANVSDGIFHKVLSVFQSFGRAEEVPEAMIHCVVGVSGSSPAYTYMYIDALARTAEKNGMEYEKGIVFAAQAVLGAAKMVLETKESPEQLRINVCSPGGTTIEAVHTLFNNGFSEKVEEGFQAAVDKSKAMSESDGKKEK